MKRYNISKVILMVLITFFSTIFINISSKTQVANASPVGEVRHKNFSVSSDAIFRGVFSSHSLYFDVDKYSEIQTLTTDIFFNISQLVDESRDATITFSLNGNPFYSAKIVYKPSEETQNLKVSIPLRLMKQGMNEFKIEAYCRISDKPCIDDVNNANWLTIQGKSNLLMDFTDKETTNNISEFAYPFIKTNQDKEYNTVIAIPDNFKEDELAAAFILQAYLGKINKYGEYSGGIIRYSNIPNDKDIIYIGGKNLPKEIKMLYAGKEGENYNDCAIIRRDTSPFNENFKLMAVISEDNQMLIKAIKLLVNKDLESQLHVDTFKVDKHTKVESDVSEQKLKLSFKDLGLNEMELKGPFRRSASLTYVLPKNRTLAKGAKVKLFTRYSQNLDFTRSLVTVYINGTPIGSKKLEKDKCNGDEVEIPIPSDINMSNYIDIKVAFDLEMANSFCQFRQEEMPWALVTGDSFIYVPNNKITFYKFDTYPYPFVADRQFNNAAIIIPENISQNDMDGLSKIMAYMGRDVEYNNGEIKVIKDKNFSNKYYNMNLIVYGTPLKNKVIKDLNSKLWFKYDKDYKSFVGNEKLYLTKPYDSNISVFQFDISPYNKGNAVLTLTSPKEDLLVNSLMYLSYSKQILKLSGDSVLIDGFGNLKTFKFKKETNKSVYDKFKAVETNTKMFMGFMGLFLIFGITAGGLYYYKNKRLK